MLAKLLRGLLAMAKSFLDENCLCPRCLEIRAMEEKMRQAKSRK